MAHRTIPYVWRYFRRRGLRATLGTIRQRVVRTQEVVIYRTVLAGPPAADASGGLRFCVAGPQHLDDLAAFERVRYGAHTRRRGHVNEDNDWLFLAWDGDRIVATRRYSRAFMPGEIWSRVLTLRASQVWSADAYCVPEYRNRGVNRQFGRFTMRYLAARGYTEEFGVIDASNAASLRSVVGRGSELVYFISYTRYFFYARLVVSANLPGYITTTLAQPVMPEVAATLRR